MINSKQKTIDVMSYLEENGLIFFASNWSKVPIAKRTNLLFLKMLMNVNGYTEWLRMKDTALFNFKKLGLLCRTHNKSTDGLLETSPNIDLSLLPDGGLPPLDSITNE